jgi:extracellular factor (EF) 3-hydroxypalmitic acid methyl ester biosynthesis protein
LLDLIYAIEDGETVPALQGSSALGRRVYEATVHQAAARAVRSCRWMIIERLNALSARMAGPHVLSVACGHLREARHCSALLQGRFGRFVAIDQDRESLAVVERDVGAFGVETMALSVRTLLKEPLALGSFDFVYASGLYDYLSHSVAQRLTDQLFALLNPGGRLLLANFLPTSDNRAFMEAYMDWWLSCRTRAEMLTLVEALPEEGLGQCHLFTDEKEQFVFVEIEHRR